MKTMTVIAAGFLFLACSARPLLALPVFPGAEGWGAETPGGRGDGSQTPRIYVVTSLDSNPTTPGTFPHALRQTGPRFIVFRVSGVIDMHTDSDWYLGQQHGHVTIAGQTSPGGVSIVSTPLPGRRAWSILHANDTGFHDAVFRFLRLRGSADVNDAIAFPRGQRIVIDHCDFSGADDETLDMTYSQDVTVQWSTIANSSGGGGCTDGLPCGSLIAYHPTDNVSLHHNLFAHHGRRGGPHMHWAGQGAGDTADVQYVNNVLYDNQHCRFLDTNPSVGRVSWNLQGNYFKAGPATAAECSGNSGPAEIYGDAYVHDNYWVQKNGQTTSETSSILDTSPALLPAPHAMPPVTTFAVLDSFGYVLDRVGAWPRDAMNVRTVQDVRDGVGALSDTSEPLIQSGPPSPRDDDGDGMADDWETAVGLAPDEPADNVQDRDGDGYLNIEEYINALASARLGEWCRIKDDGSKAAIQGILGVWGETTPGAPPEICPADPVPPARPRRLRAS